MHRFLLTESDIISPELVVVRSTELLHQWTKVLKFRDGEELVLFDGSGREWEVQIRLISKKEVICDVKRVFNSQNELSINLILAQSLVKNFEKFEWVLQKGTELGVNKFIPLITQRTVQKFLHKQERMERILKEAAEQSGRTKVPKLEEIQKFEDVIKNNVVLIPHPGVETNFSDLKKRFGELPKEVLVCIGPEGGLTEEEIDMAKKAGAYVFNIGKRVLRAETAAIVMAALVNEWIGEM